MKSSQLFNLKTATALLVCLAISVSSCNKKEDDPEPVKPTPTTPTPPPSPSTPSPTFTDGSGTLSAVKLRSFQDLPFVGTTTIDVGLAVAAFYTNPNDSTFLEAGTVTCNQTECKKQNNNAYVYEPSGANATGIAFSDANDEVTWEVTGSASVGGFTETITGNFPEVEKLTSDKTVTRANGYTLSTSAITDADSSIFMVGGIYHYVAGNGTSSSFTASELSALKEGPNFVQIAAWKITSKTVNGKTYHFVKETVINQSVTIK